MSKPIHRWWTTLLLLISSQTLRAGVPDSLQQLIDKSSDSLKVVYLSQLGNYYQNRETEKSISCFEKALNIARKMQHRHLIAMSLNNMGSVYNGMGAYPKALNYFTKALEIFETLDDKSRLAYTVNSIGNNYLGQGNNNMAEKYYKQALKYAREGNDDLMIAIASYGLAGMLELKKKYNESLTAFDEAAEKFKKLNRDFEYGAVRVTQASIYIELGKLPEAQKKAEEGVEYMKKTGDKYGTSQAIKQLAKIQMEKKNFTAAHQNITEALRLCREIGARANIKEMYQMLAHNYSQRGDKANAFVYMEKYALLNDSLFNEENAKQTAEMQEKYESVKKEKELVRKQEELKKERALSEQSETYNTIYLIGLIVMCALAVFALIAYFNHKRASKEIAIQKTIIEVKNKDITDSIRYANQIQQALLPLMDKVRDAMGELFVYYEPKDIVSGDFYWVGQKGKKIFVAAADCTGHGVPGAFMSMLGFHALDNALKDETVNSPADLLHRLHTTIIDTFRKKDRSTSVQDGMDITICSFDTTTRTLEIAAANNRVYIIRENALIEIKGDLFSIGSTEEKRNFANKSHTVQKGDTIYLFSDGFASQFGGESGKKLKYSRMKELFLKYSHLNMKDQKNVLQQELETWKGGLEQIDDILVMGIRIS